jgi:ribosomal protein S4
MSNHKIKPKAKKYIKAGIFFNIKKHKNLTLKKKKLRFFSPDFVYLNSKISNKIKDSYKISFTNRKKLKLLFGFPRTSPLKKILNKNFFKKKNSNYFLKENEFCSLLECRLDFLLFRLGLAKTLFEAKHLIAYKKIFVNGILNRSYTKRLKKGDVISFDPTVKRLVFTRLLNELVNRTFFFSLYGNLEINFKTLKIIVLTEKVNFLQQIHHYSLFLNWTSFLNG